MGRDRRIPQRGGRLVAAQARWSSELPRIKLLRSSVNRGNRSSTATVIMVEPVCRTREILRNLGYVLRAVFPTEVLGAGIYSSVIFGGSMVLANAVAR